MDVKNVLIDKICTKGVYEMTEKELTLKIIDKSKDIAKIITRGRDVEIRKSATGVSIAEVSKKVVCR